MPYSTRTLHTPLTAPLTSVSVSRGAHCDVRTRSPRGGPRWASVAVEVPEPAKRVCKPPRPRRRARHRNQRVCTAARCPRPQPLPGSHLCLRTSPRPCQRPRQRSSLCPSLAPALRAGAAVGGSLTRFEVQRDASHLARKVRLLGDASLLGRTLRTYFSSNERLVAGAEAGWAGSG